MDDVDIRILQLAARQFQVLSYDQAKSCGATDMDLMRRVASGFLLRPYERAYAIAGADFMKVETRLMAACFGAGDGALAAGEAAAYLLDVRRVAPRDLELLVRGSWRSRIGNTDGLVIHRAGRLDEVDITSVGPIPCTSVALTLFQLCVSLRPHVAEAAVERALRLGLISPEGLHAAVPRLCRKGRPGSKLFRALAADRPIDLAPTESRLEFDFISILREYSLPEPERQIRVKLPGYGNVRVDCGDRRHKLAYEIHDPYWYAGERAMLDARRRAALILTGWLVLDFFKADIKQRPWRVASEVAHAIALRTSKRVTSLSPGESDVTN